MVKVMRRGAGSIMKDLEYPIKGFCFLLEMTEIIVCAQLFQSCPTPCDPKDCSPPGSS